MKSPNDLVLQKGVRITVLIVVLAYFLVALYWFGMSTFWAIHIIDAYYYYQTMTRSIWWTLLFYSSELVGFVGTLLRLIAGIFAVYCAALFFLKGRESFEFIRRPVGWTLIFEGCFYLTLIPSVIIGFVFPFAENLWYFEITPPGLIVFLVNGLACILMLLVIPPLLFILRSKIVGKKPAQEIIKWSCLTGVAYLFIVFWFNYLLAWLASLVRWPERAQPGIEILYNPVDFVHFAITVFGLLLVAILGFVSVFPAIKGEPEKIKVKLLGVTMVGLGVYFILIFGLYVLVGGYYAHPTVWAELLSPKHNPDFWCMALIPLGFFLLLKSTKS
ncbi:MAG: hypothetical protein RMJ03_04050 [Nitrososphaerota archaeon]|nr:hypothetical protein [Candidatus Bathyarchaeota archaeon]MDW8024027.1 hypothetical protein [Nitrososphaerota archaeon]MDW8040580.1 hypothetical protein [Nitrososphaerota archaeon]